MMRSWRKEQFGRGSDLVVKTFHPTRLDIEPDVAIHVFNTEIRIIVFSCDCNCSDWLLMADI